MGGIHLEIAYMAAALERRRELERAERLARLGVPASDLPTGGAALRRLRHLLRTRRRATRARRPVLTPAE